MTKNHKLLLGAAVVIGGLYLYNRSKNSSSDEGTSEFLGRFGRRRRSSGRKAVSRRAGVQKASAGRQRYCGCVVHGEGVKVPNPSGLPCYQVCNTAKAKPMFR